MKVLPKIIRTLELFKNGDTLDFADITARTGLSRSNQAHILHALCQNRLIEKHGFGRYRLGPKLFELTGSGAGRDTLQMLARRTADNIAGSLQELGVVVGIWRRKRITIAKAQPERMVQLSIADRHFEHSGWYSLSSGRLLLALQDDDTIREIVQTVGAPSPEEWPEATTMDDLFREARKIRSDRQVVMRRENGKLTSLAVPAADASGADALALSTVYITGSKELDDQAVIAKLHLIAADFAGQMQFHQITMNVLE